MNRAYWRVQRRSQPGTWNDYPMDEWEVIAIPAVCSECKGQNMTDDGPIIHAATCSKDSAVDAPNDGDLIVGDMAYDD